MKRLVYVINGPNLNLLGKRQPAIYGQETLADVEIACRGVATVCNLELEFRQSNREYEIIDWIHEALNAFDGPVFEIHISNVHKREAFRHHSYVSSRADGVIAGFGTQGYTLALQRLARLIDETAAKSG